MPNGRFPQVLRDVRFGGQRHRLRGADVARSYRPERPRPFDGILRGRGGRTGAGRALWAKGGQGLVLSPRGDDGVAATPRPRRGYAIEVRRGDVAETRRGDAAAATRTYEGDGARPRYLYETPRVPSPDPDVDSLIAGFKDASLAQTVSADDVRDRAMLALANEGFRVLEERLALRPSDIDVVWTSGYGFPRHVGGPMHWAEARGLAEVRDRLVGFAAERPSVPYLQPAKLLADMADVGAPLKDWEKFL